MLAGRILGGLLVVAAAAIVSVATPAPARPSPESAATLQPRSTPDTKILEDLLYALGIMQQTWFEPWQGKWPQAIDWGSAVIATHIAAALSSMSFGLPMLHNTARATANHDVKRENWISGYFSQILSFYYAQDHMAIHGQANDDMLWVVLGWLEAIKFVDMHSQRFSKEALPGQTEYTNPVTHEHYYANTWTPAFAHRSRVFWELAGHGWDEKWCGGGMRWSNHLQPYKNAITNELWIAASVDMYLYFPGDDNTSPYRARKKRDADNRNLGNHTVGSQIAGPRSNQHLEAAIKGHVWLSKSGMRNGKGQHPEGLYVDGYHISGTDEWDIGRQPWNVPDPMPPRDEKNTKCDMRTSRVWSYNQGVILSGLRGLWASLGDEAYLREGHELIRAVIAATGWHLDLNKITDSIPGQADELPPYYGLGRLGVMEDDCDAIGDCSQDAQLFKGIFFHHFAAFCAPLELHPTLPERQQHIKDCLAYRPWVAHNVKAAKDTRDYAGRFGMWWTAGIIGFSPTPRPASNKRDDAVWRLSARAGQLATQEPESISIPDHPHHRVQADQRQRLSQQPKRPMRPAEGPTDPNERGRGRTVETQSCGVALLRAYWELTTMMT